MGKQFKAGQTAYDSSGYKVFINAITDNGMAVCSNFVEIYDEDYPEEEISERLFFCDLEKLSVRPPKNAISEEAKSLLDVKEQISKEITELRSEKSEIQRALLYLSSRKEALFAEVEKLKPLENIKRFLVEEPKFFVVSVYSDEVYAIKKAPEFYDNDYRERGLKLLTLFGRSGGNLEWGINNYRDGSGTWQEAYPAYSEEEAEQIRIDRISEKLAEATPDNISHTMRVVRVSLKAGIEVPEDVLKAFHAKEEESKNSNIQHIEKQISDLQSRLKEVRKK